MFTCEELITAAYRRSGILNPRMTLQKHHADAGLEAVQRMYMNLLGGGTLGRLTDVFLSGDDYTEFDTYTPGEWTRNSSIYALAVTPPVTVTDLKTGKVRTPYDGAVITYAQLDIDESLLGRQTGGEGESPVFVPDPRKVWVYDALMGKWRELYSLTLTKQAPLFDRYGPGLSALLAATLAEEFGRDITKLVAKEASMCKLQIASKYDQFRRETGAGDDVNGAGGVSYF